MACSGVLRDARSESSAVRERRSCRGFGAALTIASRLGVGAQRAVGLAVWNNTIIRLLPNSIRGEDPNQSLRVSVDDRFRPDTDPT